MGANVFSHQVETCHAAGCLSLVAQAEAARLGTLGFEWLAPAVPAVLCPLQLGLAAQRQLRQVSEDAQALQVVWPAAWHQISEL